MRILKPVRMLWRLQADGRGAAMVEYALLAALIAVVALSTITSLGTGVKNQFSTISTKL